uniref:Uncharacterized protein n=1 Tax=Oryza glumipatula TaxID=40148 RepID=A0A0E0BGY7_9ORYZ
MEPDVWSSLLVGVLPSIWISLIRGWRSSLGVLRVVRGRSLRSLVVFDDIEKQQWNRSILPENTRSRIIVTTTSQLVAKYCSYGGGYIHNTSTLDKKHSDDLLKALLTGHSRDLEQVSSSIVDTCDGHPLSLVSVANFLRSVNSLTESSEDICHRLGSQVEEAPAFQELREVLMSNYGNLSDHLVKTCLLYMSVFPKGYEIRRNSPARRWVAEGYAQSVGKFTDEKVAHQNFKKLLDQNIIEPMESDDPSTFRHLFIQNCTNINILRLAKKKLRARSLTIFGNGGGAVSCIIAKCKLLQALDLKECNDFGDNLLNDIMKDNLRRLKYLSLGNATTTVPDSVDKLHCLHTLELRKTNIVALHIEVLELPHLVHLFGKVKLRKKRIIHVISKKKVIGLQTLSGFIVDKDSIPQLIVLMRGLRKVKIWCDSTGEGNTNWNIHLKEAIENMVMYEMDTGVGVRSLSLYLGNALENLLGRLGETNGFLTTLKLHGRLSRFPKFVTSLTGIKELCLSSTNLTGSDLSVSGLGELPCLLYLKLVEYNLVGFVIKKGDYPVLQRLCLVVESPNPVLPTIEEEALPELVSLHLLCGHLVNLAGINIRNHTNLQEVALDSARVNGKQSFMFNYFGIYSVSDSSFRAH